MAALVPFTMDFLPDILATTYEKYKKRKLKILQDAIIQEIGDGRYSSLRASTEDDAIEIVIRLQQATILGAAKINLRLMAKVLRGLSEKGDLHSSDFARFQKMLGDLSRNEIVLLATLHKEYQSAKKSGRSAAIFDAWHTTEKKLVPMIFPSEGHMRAAAYSAQRTGLLIAKEGMDATTFLWPSPLLDELIELTQLDESLWSERT